MRLIFIFLLIANVAFFAGQYFLGGASVAPPKQPVPSVAVDGQLQLLAETGSGYQAQPRPAVGARPMEAGDGLCTLVGPFAQLLHAEYLVERLTALSVAAQVSQVGISDGETHWVYLAPEMSEKEAWRRLHELQQKNIESYLITRGDLINGISFGRYASMQEALARKQEIDGLGYGAQILSVPKIINEIWVVLPQGEGDSLSNDFWSDVLAQQPSLEKRQNLCAGVAPQ